MIVSTAHNRHCFGQLSSGPISWLTVVRNIALTLAAGVVWWRAQSRETTHIWEHLSWPVAAAGLVAVVIAVMGFVATVALAKFLMRGEVVEW